MLGRVLTANFDLSRWQVWSIRTQPQPVLRTFTDASWDQQQETQSGWQGFSLSLCWLLIFSPVSVWSSVNTTFVSGCCPISMKRDVSCYSGQVVQNVKFSPINCPVSVRCNKLAFWPIQQVNVTHIYRLDCVQRAQTSTKDKLSAKTDPAFESGFTD